MSSSDASRIWPTINDRRRCRTSGTLEYRANAPEESRPIFHIKRDTTGAGVYLVKESLAGILRVTTSTAEQREHVRGKNRISFAEGDGNNEYARNIQIADLNALNAALAVIKWKKLRGFYVDLEKEYHSTYTIDGNKLINDDQA